MKRNKKRKWEVKVIGKWVGMTFLAGSWDSEKMLGFGMFKKPNLASFEVARFGK